MKRLKELKLGGTAIKELPLSIGHLSGLTLLDLNRCRFLTSLPCNISLDSLEALILSGCSKLKKLPEIVGNMKRLKVLRLNGTAIKELPLSIGQLSDLTLLDLKRCKSLTNLPCNISLDSLEALILSDCSKLEKLPEIVRNMERLKVLRLNGTAIKELPLSIGHLSGLTILDLKDCKSLLTLPSVICNLTSLQYLNLSGCSKVDKLPNDFGNLKILKVLVGLSKNPQTHLMGPMVGRILKIPYKFQMGQLQSQWQKIKEAMQGFVQSTWAEFANLSSKTPTFKMDLKEEEPTLIHVIQATDGGGIA
jgi:Leucine-rich repeat (LRR) protein